MPQPLMIPSTVAQRFDYGRLDCGLSHSLSFLLSRESPIRGHVIHEAWEILTEPGEQVIALHAGMLGQRIERVDAGRLSQAVRRDLLVGPGANPGLRGRPFSATLQVPDEIAEPVAQYGSGSVRDRLWRTAPSETFTPSNATNVVASKFGVISSR